MMTWNMLLTRITLCFAVGLWGMASAYAQTSPDGNYIVQYGDTLWDIAAEQLQNSGRWREIHRNNPSITNPHLIYPGDILGLGPATGADGQGATGKGRKSDKIIARPWYGLPAPAPETPKARRIPEALVPSTDFIESSGYIVPYSMKELLSEEFAQITGMASEEDGQMKLIQSEYGQPGLVFGDTIYINRGTLHKIQDGDVFLAFSPKQEVFHPVTGELIGTQIEISGHLRIKALETNVACAEIIKSYDYMEIGDHVMPISEISSPLKKPEVGNSKSYGLLVGNQLIAHIIRERVGRPGISFGDIVYLDVGAAQGVQPADNFIVFREVGEGFPRQGLGRLTVLSVQEQTSTALVTESVKTIELGEKAVLRR